MKIKRDLKKGMKGDDVKRLQEELKALGYDPGPIDGDFGDKTEKAVRKFQEEKGLTVDGVVGKNTAKYINTLNLLKKTYGMLEKVKDKLCEEQKKEFKELTTEIEGIIPEKPTIPEKPPTPEKSIITPEDKKRWNNETNVKVLARIIMSEASIGNEAERTAVGYTVLNRMKRNKTNKVADVMGGFAHNQAPSQAIIKLAKEILACTVPDNSGGATHFYSPQSMPKKGDERKPGFKKFDTKGGLEKTPGLPKENYKPGWANTFPRVSVEGIRETHYKFYRQPGSGKVR